MGAIISINHETNELVVYSKLVLYGSEATDEVGKKIKQEIETLYNEPQVEVQEEGKTLRVVFKIDYELTTGRNAYNWAKANQDFSMNFIRIEAANEITRSFMGFGLGENSGHWITSDQLGDSTTVAHEFGHCLGLDHPFDLDFRGVDSPPPMMAPRGSLVDAKYQWNPSVAAGEFGGTMKPIYRRVHREEVLAILQNARKKSDGLLAIGKLTNRIFDSKGSEILFA